MLRRLSRRSGDLAAALWAPLALRARPNAFKKRFTPRTIARSAFFRGGGGGGGGGAGASCHDWIRAERYVYDGVV